MSDHDCCDTDCFLMRPHPCCAGPRAACRLNQQAHPKTDNANTGHGHVTPRPDGVRARCGGPFICNICSTEYAQKHSPVFCEHANENPNICRCPPNCSCKTTTCKNKYHTLKQRPEDQQLPVKNDNPAIQDLVIADMEARKAIGLKRYGTLLQAHNGRDFLKDTYEELLDACNYIRGVMFERDGK